jgi:hypothetical protein
MNLIVSWSGSVSHDLAIFLKDWLHEMFPVIDPWVSSEDIQKGKSWFPELMNKFSETNVSIICVTTENVLSPWVYFEAGLIAAKVKGMTCSYLVGVPGKRIKDTPLAQFQWTEANRNDTWKMICSINTELKTKGAHEKILESHFNALWPKLKAKLDDVPSDAATPGDSVLQVHAPKPPLRPAAKRLLLEAVADPHGKISVTRDNRAFCIQTNGREFVGSHDPKLWATWKGAVDELEKLDYINNLGGNGQVFDLRDTGIERAADLKENDPVHSLTAEAQQLLVEAADEDGIIVFAKNDLGPAILVAGQEFTKPGNPEESAKWIHGFKQLRERHFIKNDGEESVFRLQKVGFDAAKELKFQPQ